VEERRRLFIGGAWAAATGGGLLEVISPHSEKPIAAALITGEMGSPISFAKSISGAAAGG
jgi:hypothetical protein